MQQDCIEPLNKLIKTQSAEMARLASLAKVECDKLYGIDKDIKASAVHYFKSAKDCEELMDKYRKMKFSAEISFQARSLVHQ